jgi:hypothetical protein
MEAEDGMDELSGRRDEDQNKTKKKDERMDKYLKEDLGSH